MSLQIVLIIVSIAAVVGAGFGYFLRWALTQSKRGSLELEIKQKMLEAKESAQKILAEAEKKAKDTIDELTKEWKIKNEELKQKDGRLVKKEEHVDKQRADLEQEIDLARKKIEEIKAIKVRAEALLAERTNELERVAKLTREQAVEEIIAVVERQNEEDIMVRLNKLEITGQERLERRAKEILLSSIHRLGNAVNSDVLTTSVTLPSDDMKGKIIGKEGRNIKAFERATGVEVIVDDTPGVIVLSSFDPVRRQVARLALENLILDGRIQPAKIEEMTQKATQEINKVIKEKGEQAVYECGVYNLDPRIVSILGRLYFRTSYGQNVLQHSIEMAHIAGMIAEEIGANVTTAKTGALLHDIGKAVDHEVQGTHVEIGRRILQKFNAPEAVIKAMQSHHEEYPYETPESIIVQVADAISGGRPGARRDTVENYLKRLSDLEAIASSFGGVEKSFALQAGREIRVFVTPEQITDIEAKRLGREIALRIESELKYPGEIKVTIIRETRITEYAR